MRLRVPGVRPLLVLAAGGTGTGLALLAMFTGLVQVSELDSVDARFSIRGETSTGSPPVAVVGIDDATFQDLDEPYPFRRSLHARVIDRLVDAGASAIVYDIQFTEPTETVEDNALIRAIEGARGRVVLATTEVNEFGETAVLGGEGSLRSIGARAAHGSLPQDTDAVGRRFASTVSGIPSIAVAATEVATGRRAARSWFREDGTAWIDYAGPPGTVPTYSFSEVLNRRVPPSALRGRIVVVGASAPTLQDVHPTSMSGTELMSGPEIQANAISTVVRGVPLREIPGWLRVVVVILLGFGPPLLALRLGAVAWVAGSAALAGLYALAVQVAFQGGEILPFVVPLAALVVSATATLLAVLAFELAATASEKQRVREIFTRFVPARVVDDVLASTNGDLRLGGKRVQATVVFCDLREFTTFAERVPAEQVIETLNCFLGEMTEAILAEDGTIIAYQGDGILAAFGAPLEQIDHADRAVAAVREMVGPRLDRVNAWLRERGLSEGFRMGVGVNSGIVMSGNVGSAARMEYSAIGDTVNTASRLEKMTKDTPHAVLISDTTRAMLRSDAADLSYVDAVTVRGKRAKANLWTLDAPEVRQTA
jgi:adenylate cyclase